MLKADFGVDYPKGIIDDTAQEIQTQFINVILSWHEALLTYINKVLKIESRDLTVDTKSTKTNIYFETPYTSTLMYTITFGVDQVKSEENGDYNMKLDISIKSWNEYNVDMPTLQKIQEKLV